MAVGRTEQEMLEAIVRAVADNPAIAAKRDIGLVSEVLPLASWQAGPGDDGAVVSVGSESIIACGEAIFPPFVAADPRGAGIAAVLANVNDVAAMGAVPLAIVDTVVADRETARQVLAGMNWAAELYRVPIVGGHLTIRDGAPSVSAFALGTTDRPLSVEGCTPGQDLVMAACLEGSMRADFPFFASFESRGKRSGDDVRILARIATKGLATSAKDISMAGLVGSLAMMLEYAGLGVEIDVMAVPAPTNAPLETWFNCFPAYAFLLTCDPTTTEACVAEFQSAGLTASPVGVLDDSGSIRLRIGALSVHCLEVAHATGIAKPVQT